MNEKTKIVIFYAWGRRNAGDHALILGALELLQSVVDLDDVVVVSRYAESNGSICPISEIRKHFPAVEVVTSSVDLTNRSGFKRLRQIIAGFFWFTLGVSCPKLVIRIKKEDAYWEAFSKARFVLLNGGNLFFWHRVRRNALRLFGLAFPLMIARRMGIPYGLLPQTCGAFEGTVPRLIGLLFEKAAFVTFRDSDSKKHAESVAAINARCYAVLPDLAFSLTRKNTYSKRAVGAKNADSQNNFFCVCLRTGPLGDDVKLIHDNSEETERKILTLLPQVITEFQRISKLKCVVVVQVDHDRHVSKKLLSMLNELGVISSCVEIRDPYEYLDLYYHARFLISFRLHSMIFALSQGTPVIGMWRKPLGTKIPSMMHDIGLDEYVFELDDAIQGDVLSCMIKVNMEREALRSRIVSLVASRQSCGHSFFRKKFLSVHPRAIQGM